ncbi:hypothetical protein [Candidatus Lariskella endosymbiont of Hedychridium roseum]
MTIKSQLGTGYARGLMSILHKPFKNLARPKIPSMSDEYTSNAAD